MASRKFVEDFDLVAEYYKCDPAEIENMKAAARADMTNAEQSFTLLADEIRKEKVKK